MAVDVAQAHELDLSFLRAKRRPPGVPSAGPEIGIVDLFSGCGGMTIGAIEGARRAGRAASLRLAADIFTPALEALQLTLGADDDCVARIDLASVVGGVAEAVRPSERQLLEAGAGARLLMAGPPCQGHSALNNHTRHDDARNDLYLAVARVARLLKPTVVIIENVRGVGRDRRSALARCTAALQELDYTVAPKLIDLHQLGAPQTRVRHVLVATRGRGFDFEGLRKRPGRSVGWAIEDIDGIDGQTLFDTASVPSAENERRMAWLFEHDADDLPNGERPICHRSNHSYRSMYGRLCWDEPAQTITTGFGSMGQGRFVHPRSRRTLTPHEAARLQFLPDFMEFSIAEHRSALATMIGNAAPPVLTMSLVEALLEQELL
ncbi:MAG: DNA cytosine methyltransferase [Solirubrobacteraceae bacterium]